MEIASFRTIIIQYFTTSYSCSIDTPSHKALFNPHYLNILEPSYKTKSRCPYGHLPYTISFFHWKLFSLSLCLGYFNNQSIRISNCKTSRFWRLWYDIRSKMSHRLCLFFQFCKWYIKDESVIPDAISATTVMILLVLRSISWLFQFSPKRISSLYSHLHTYRHHRCTSRSTFVHFL